MIRTPVTSSQIASTGYDPGTQTLEIEFKNAQGPNSVYQYTGFTPEDWSKFQSAPSAGSHFYKHIKGRFPYKKVA